MPRSKIGPAEVSGPTASNAPFDECTCYVYVTSSHGTLTCATLSRNNFRTTSSRTKACDYGAYADSDCTTMTRRSINHDPAETFERTAELRQIRDERGSRSVLLGRAACGDTFSTCRTSHVEKRAATATSLEPAMLRLCRRFREEAPDRVVLDWPSVSRPGL